MASSVTTVSTARHTVASKIVITLQAFVILSLTYWILEEYLNNMYLRQYVGDFLATNGFVIGILGGLLMLGSLSSLMVARRRHGEKRFGSVSLEVTSSASKVKLAAGSNIKASEANAKAVGAFSKPNMDFHPVVAALKADMADRRLSFGSAASSSNDQSQMPSGPSPGVQKTSVLYQFDTSHQPPVTGPRPAQIGVLSPQGTSQDSKPQDATGGTEKAGALVTQRPMPLLTTQQPAGSTVLQP
ncbi:MAG TPA: hypothetical protein VNA15_09290, partial [Candidatus Angelobacter sp.]|nr:hypothetical protein [Candidatus Angelobacter sp.]